MIFLFSVVAQCAVYLLVHQFIVSDEWYNKVMLCIGSMFLQLCLL